MLPKAWDVRHEQDRLGASLLATRSVCFAQWHQLASDHGLSFRGFCRANGAGVKATSIFAQIEASEEEIYCKKSPACRRSEGSQGLAKSSGRELLCVRWQRLVALTL
jgi:hypothetical protein